MRLKSSDAKGVAKNGQIEPQPRHNDHDHSYKCLTNVQEVVQNHEPTDWGGALTYGVSENLKPLLLIM